MAQGLDELIEWLIGEVAFFGEGCAISDIFASVRKHGKDAQVTDDNKPETGGSNAAAIEAAAKAPLTNAELRLGRLIWSHIIDTGDVSVGPNGKWNLLTFDELVSIPEDKAEGSGAAIKDIKARLKDSQPEQTERTSTENPSNTRKLPKIRPRLFVSEETVWKTLTGHGIDFKRVPLMEWRLIVCIGSTKEAGIAQPDLVRATGQDKRSVPKRTDFLDIKGYIVKRTHMFRGMKTSKLWLTQFAPELPAPTNTLKGLDMSKALMTRDMDPVPWVHQWVGNKNAKGKEELAYHALIQTVVAIIKAWGTVRVRDLKKKLGIIGLRWQMKIVSRFLRRAEKRGNLAYTAAQFMGNNVIFKDCVKFIREPTEDDWRVLLATGVRSNPNYVRSNQKNRKKLKAKRGRPRTKTVAAKPKARVLRKRFRLPPSPALAQWKPEKPIANTVADYVLTGGKEGYTSAEISTALVGTEFRRYLHKHLSNMCQPDVQPPGLSEYQMTSELTRSGKVQAYVFSCAGPPLPEPAQTASMNLAIDPTLVQQSVENEIEIDIDDFGFGTVDPSTLVDQDSVDLASLVKLEPPKKSKPKRNYKPRRTQAEELAEDEASQPPAVPKKPRRETPRQEEPEEGEKEEAPKAAPGRRGRKRKAARKVSYKDNLGALIDGSATGSDEEDIPAHSAAKKPALTELLDEVEQSGAESVKSVETAAESEESDETPDRTLPGVYVGIPGSLNPDPRKKGRPRRSLVLIFRSDKLKDPDFLPGRQHYPRPRYQAAAAPLRKPAPKRKPPTPPGSSKASTPAPPQSEEVPRSPPVQVAIAPRKRGRPRKKRDDDPTPVQSTKTQSANAVAVAEPHFVLITSDLNPVEDAVEEAVASPEPAVAAPQKRKKKEPAEGVPQIIKPNEVGKFVCATCSGTWANDNGLVYHLTKGKNLCNPFYASNPELMTKPKPRAGRYASSESAAPGSQASSAPVNSSEGSLASEPPPSPFMGPLPKGKKKRRRPAKKTDRSAPVVPEPSDSVVPAEPRPVLKPRSMPKNGRLGGSGIIPRGVEASEAAAKRIAAARIVQDTNDAAASSTGSVADKMEIDEQAAAEPAREYWKPDEELTYLKHIHAKSGKPSQHNSLEEASQRSSENNQGYQAFDVQYAGASFSEEDSPPQFPDSPNAPGVSDYPAELLDPALQAPTAKGEVGSASSAMAPVRIRKLLPGGRPAASTKTSTRVAVQAVSHGGSVQRPPPSVRMPSSKYAAKNRDYYATAAERQLLPLRIQEIILYLVTSNGGAYPKDRKTLHWSILKVFRATFQSSHLLPTLAGTARALGSLERDKVVKTASVAIQPGGSWKQYDIVYLPEIRIKEDPVVAHLKARAEALDPEMYIPIPFNPTAEEQIYFASLERPMKPKTKGPGRRDHKLAGEIATLNAPFYKEKGLAGVRPRFGRQRMESESENEGLPKKRRRTIRKDADGFAIKRKRLDVEDGQRPIRRRRGRKRRNGEDEFVILEPSKLSIVGGYSANPGISSLPASFFSHTAPSKINFLPPNTQLDNDYEPSTSSEPSVHEEEVDKSEEPMVPPGTCAETIEIRAHNRGVWPKIPNTWFEKNSASFAMKGWLPSQTERLIANLPKTSAEMGFKITSHCKTEQWADPAYGVFLTSVDGCRSWELSDLGKHFMSGTIAPDYVFMNFNSTKEVASMAPVDLDWLDENEWTLETIPYEQLEDNDNDPFLQYDISSLTVPKRGPGRPRVRPLPPHANGQRKARDSRVRELKMQRELNSYPTTKQEYYRTKGEESLGIDWKSEDTRIAAYVAVSTLTGGINKAMDWGLMMRLFPEAKLSNLRKFWSMIKKEREGFIHSLAEKFQDEFLGAYENGELGKFDFDDPLNYDWLKLVKWTVALVVREGIELPPSRERLENDLELQLVDPNDYDWRETYHHWQRSVFNKFQDSTSEPASRALNATRKVVPNKKSTSNPASANLDVERKALDNDRIIARSWVRALCCTNPEDYNPVKIRDKFKSLVLQGHRTEQEVSELLESTILDLEHRRIAIKAKSTALQYGRPYRLNDHFARTLDRYANEMKWSVAAEFKSKLDDAFRIGEPVEIPWRTEDGMVVAALNLQAAGRVRIEPTPATKLHIPFGFKPGFYESRKLPKSHYRFALQVVPTDRYLYNEDIEILHRTTAPDNIPTTTADGKLPMWCDFFGTPHRGRWFKMLGGVFFTYATRGAMTDDFTAQALKPCYEQFEVEAVRKWGLEQGLLRELTGPGSAATLTEWWWLVLGQPLLEMAREEAVGEQADGGLDDDLAGGASTAGEGATAGEGESSTWAAKSDGRRTKDQYTEVSSARGRRHGKYRVL
ncbi:unnamed protein product [Discula destructiva]